jgi:uncharacterized protein YndB with AHSA1/START domain
VRREITVAVPAAKAFAVFTEGFATWWPESHHLGAAPLERVTMEPGVGGRWYERTVDGAECDWGAILAWEPPHRLVLSWHLDGNWEIDPDPTHASEIEVTFVEGDEVTVVVVEHRHLDRHGDTAAGVREGVGGDGGWSGLLAAFAAVVVDA